MFFSGSSELLLIACIALLVLSPQRIPQLIRDVLVCFRWIQTTCSHIKEELFRSLNIREIQQDLHNEQTLKVLDEEDQRTTDKSS